MSIDYEQAERAVRERLKPPAADHSVRVADTAVLLATLYGVDVEAARLAGVLHDWDREQGSEELLVNAIASGQAVDEADRQVPYLLHARTGAAALRIRFPELSQEVLHAIERHTVGDLTMSELDMVVYVADMIEPTRDFAGVDDLREAAGTLSLRDLFAQAYRASVAHLVDKRKRIHPTTVAVWNAYVVQEQR